MRKRHSRAFLIVVGIILIGTLGSAYVFSNASVKAYDAREVVLDAGHGGHDPGGDGYGMLEKDITLEITLKVKDYLESAGIRVTTTRDEDISLGDNEIDDLAKRVEIANATNARYFVSIHTNASKSHSANGIELYYGTRGKSLATQIHNELIDENYSENRGLFKGSKLYVLRNTKMASVLVEVGFLDGISDSKDLQNFNTKNKIAKRIANGILKQMEIEDHK